MDFQDLGLKYSLGQNGGRDDAMLTPTNSFLSLGFLRLC